ncbi:TolC family protein [Phormidesmis sp. 146-35]
MSLHLMSVGVGALIAFGSTGVAYSQTLSDGQPQNQRPIPSNSPAKDSSVKKPAISSSDSQGVAGIAQFFRPETQTNSSLRQASSGNSITKNPTKDNPTKDSSTNSPTKKSVAEVAQIFRSEKQTNSSPRQVSLDKLPKDNLLGNLTQPSVAKVAQAFKPEIQPNSRRAQALPKQSVVAPLPSVGTIASRNLQTIAQTFNPPQIEAVSLPKIGTLAQAFNRPVTAQKRSVSQVVKPGERTLPKAAAPIKGSPAISSRSPQGVAQLPPVVEVPKLEDVARAFEPEKLADTRTTQPPKPTAQNTPPAKPPTPSTPLPPAGPPSNTTPTPTPTPAPSENPRPSAPTPGRIEPAPDYLNPSPNPLQFPTRPEEVRLQGTQPITLAQAIELSERNNRDLQVARLQLESTQSALREAQAANSPTLAVQADLTRAQSAGSEIDRKARAFQQRNNPFFQEDDSDPVNTTLNGSLQLSYDIYTSGLRPARNRAAERQVRVNELEVERVREDLRLNVSNDYYDLQDADEQVRINAAAVRNAEISLRDTQAQERAGLGTRFDVLRSRVQLANAQQQLTNSIATQAVRRRQLAQRISIAESVNLSAADPVTTAGTWPLSIEDSIVLAYKNRAELEQQLVQREVSEQQRKAALSALGPTVSVSAQYNLSDIFEQPVRAADGYSIGLQARWSLYDGGAAVARARQQEKNKEIAEARFAQSRNTVRFQVEQAFSTLQSNRINITTAGTALNEARESLRLARLRFQAGVGTQTEVINAETDLTRAEGSLVSAILGYNRSLAQLQRAVSNISRQ